MRLCTRIMLFLLCSILIVPSPSTAATVVIQPFRDNTLYEDAGGAFSNGRGDHLFTGLNGQSKRRRALLAFDVTANVPAGATITAATLRVHMSATAAGPDPTTLHRLTGVWGEGTSDGPGAEGQGAPSTPGDATWIHRLYSSLFWSTPGGDFLPASAMTPVDTIGDYAWSSAQLTADVQDMLDNPSANQGWILVGEETTPEITKRFDSRESSNPPTLEIHYAFVVDIPASKDNTLFQDSTGASSNGMGEYFFAGRTGGTTAANRRGVIAFAVASVVPAGATIEDGSLILEMTASVSPALNVTLYRLEADWGEGASDATGAEGQGAPSDPMDATWLHTFFDNQFWIAPGGDYTAAVSAGVPVGATGTYVWTSPQLTTDVQDMLDNPADNFGWIVIGDETADFSAKRFNSRQNATAPPILRVAYTTAFTPTAADPVPEIPATFRLEPPSPNPFNPTTTIAFTLERPARARLEIYDVGGRRISTLLDGVQPATRHLVTWDGHNDAGETIASGVYFVRLESGGLAETQKLILLK